MNRRMPDAILYNMKYPLHLFYYGESFTGIII